MAVGIKLDGFGMAARIDCSFCAAAQAKRARLERQISERDRRPQNHQREDPLFRRRTVRDLRDRLRGAGFSIREWVSKEPYVFKHGLKCGERIFLWTRVE
jgi:hypothetical protein